MVGSSWGWEEGGPMNKGLPNLHCIPTWARNGHSYVDGQRPWNPVVSNNQVTPVCQHSNLFLKWGQYLSEMGGVARRQMGRRLVHGTGGEAPLVQTTVGRQVRALLRTQCFLPSVHPCRSRLQGHGTEMFKRAGWGEGGTDKWLQVSIAHSCCRFHDR